MQEFSIGILYLVLRAYFRNSIPLAKGKHIIKLIAHVWLCHTLIRSEMTGGCARYCITLAIRLDLRFIIKDFNLILIRKNSVSHIFGIHFL